MSCPNNGQGKKVFQDEDLKLELWGSLLLDRSLGSE